MVSIDVKNAFNREYTKKRDLLPLKPNFSMQELPVYTVQYTMYRFYTGDSYNIKNYLVRYKEIILKKKRMSKWPYDKANIQMKLNNSILR